MRELRRTVALRRDAEGTLDTVFSRFPFRDQMDVAKLAMAYAIRQGLSLSVDQEYPGGGVGMTWSAAGTVDVDGSLRELLSALYPEEEDPYEILQTLMNKGLYAIQKDLDAGLIQSLEDLVNPPLPGAAQYGGAPGPSPVPS